MKKSLILTVLFAFVLSFGVLTAFPDHASAASSVAKSGAVKDVKHAGAKNGKSPKSVNHKKSSKGAKGTKHSKAPKKAKSSKHGKAKHSKTKKHVKHGTK